MNNTSADTQRNSVRSQVILLVISLSAIARRIAISLFISAIISQPLSERVGIAEEVSKGNLNVNIRMGSKDETGILDGSFNLLEVFKGLIQDLASMVDDHGRDEIDSYLDPKNYSGGYGAEATSVNKMVQEYIPLVNSFDYYATLFGKFITAISVMAERIVFTILSNCFAPSMQTAYHT